MSRYLVLGARPWNRLAFDELVRRMPEHSWAFVEPSTGSLILDTPQPAAAFVLHWHHKFAPVQLARCPFVGFHMGTLPEHRGGSPLQHLIAAGRVSTMMNAIRLTAALDGGPVVGGRLLSLDGAAEEIYLRADRLAVDMIDDLVAAPHRMDEGVPQTAPTRPPFKRRTPAQSRVPADLSLLRLHDHVRMLDAEGYPRAFVEVDGYRIELTRSSLRHDGVLADARITRVNG